MHNLTKIKIFRIICWITYPVALIFIYPFALRKKKNKSPLFFFFDRYTIGGAQTVHLDILESVKDVYKQVYFTRRSLNDALKKTFYSIPNTENREINFWCDHLLFRPFTVHFYAFYLNRHQSAHVYCSNSTFFYDLLPFLKKHFTKTELLHNFMHNKNGMEFFGLANYRNLTWRHVIDAFTLRNIREQYAAFNVPPEYNERVLLIETGIEIPSSLSKDYTLPLNILYAGRGGKQKRIWLMNKIAEHCIGQKWPVTFHFAGTLEDELSEPVKSHAVVHGAISSKEKMNLLYSQSHIILMTSAYEGFPMLIKEGMAYGCVPVVTALEGNKMHLIHGENALLIDAIEDEEKVVEQGLQRIQELVTNGPLLRKLSEKAWRYAGNTFPKHKFLEKCRKLLLSNQPHL